MCSFYTKNGLAPEIISVHNNIIYTNCTKVMFMCVCVLCILSSKSEEMYVTCVWCMQMSFNMLHFASIDSYLTCKNSCIEIFSKYV